MWVRPSRSDHLGQSLGPDNRFGLYGSINLSKPQFPSQ